MDKEKRLYKSRNNKMLDGVCGGIGEYLGIDPTLVRVVWALLTTLGGSGIFLYIVCAIIMQNEPIDKEDNQKKEEELAVK